MENHKLQTNLTILLSSSFVACLIFVFIGWIDNQFNSIPWLTLIISGTFGLFITIIVSARSKKLLSFLADSEAEKRTTALRTIKNNAKAINELSKLYFETMEQKKVNTQEQKKSFLAILPTLKESLKISQNSLPVLGILVSTPNMEKLEKHIDLLNDLFLILEHGSDEQFEMNIEKFQKYSNKVSEFLKEIL